MLAKTFRKMPDDPMFESLDPLMRIYLFEHFVNDQQDKKELLKMAAILTGSFTNPEAARQMIRAEEPDHQSSDEDFERTMQMVEADRKRWLADQGRKRRRRVPNLKT